jgi:pantoate--beta-alanine ligase
LIKNHLGLQKYSEMRTLTKVIEVRNYLSSLNLSPLGLVPTMGALHQGHTSLVTRAVGTCPVVGVSIFINPSQFNDPEDLKNYPRTEMKDLEILGSILREKDFVFIPSVKEIYPEEDTREFNFGNLEMVMEGLQRPGHFQGVARVVTRLFDIFSPDIAFFGLKDFQQLAIIRRLVAFQDYRIKIIGCPIVRENDGLAMSSRNQLLEPEIRNRAGIIFNVLSEVTKMSRQNKIADIETFVTAKINSTEGFKLEYFNIVDENDLIPVKTRNEIRKGMRYFACIAVKAGKIRLIDNIEISLV